MRSPRRPTIIVVGGALAVGSVAYGLGTQADDGTAVADSAAGAEESPDGGPPRFFMRAVAPGSSNLADSLGVDADELQAALRDFDAQQAGGRREEFSKALAKALEISSDKVQDAFDEIRRRHEDRLAGRLAKALGVDTDRVKDALETLRDERAVPFGGLAAKLADELGLKEADVREALIEAGPPLPQRGWHPGGPQRRPSMPLRRLASELGVSRADLRKALAELRPDGPRRFRADQRELAGFLAERFDLDADKVSDALAELGPPVGSRHRPGLPDHPRPL